MTPIEKQISFYNRYFVFKKVANVDVEDVFRSVTGVHVFQEKMNLADSASVQKLALQLTGKGEGEGAALASSKGNLVMSYRASKVADLEKMGAEAEVLELEEDLDSGISPKKKDATISKLFGSSKPKGKKAETSSASASASGTGKLVVKKKSVLEPVSLGAVSAPASIVGKSKSGTKASLLKLGKLSLGSASTSTSKGDE
jgi:hypothetical protein